MTDAEQFLNDLEAKAKAAEKNWRKKYSEESDEAIRQLEASMNFIDIANPAAVLRLVGMVRWLAAGCDCDAEPCQYGHCTPNCRLKMAYNTTEYHHD